MQVVIDDYQRMLARAAQGETDIAAQAQSVHTLKRETNKRFEKIEISLTAIGHRQFLLAWSDEIEKAARELSIESANWDLTDEKQWSDWEDMHSGWENRLSDWLFLAQAYRLNIRKDVLNAPEAYFHNSRWKHADSDFRDSNAVRKYKKFRIVYGNWHAVKDDVHDAVRRVAFEAGTPAIWQEG